MRKGILYIILIVLLSQLSGCAYYNTFYNARKFYGVAAKERKKRERLQVVELSPEEKQQQKNLGNVSTSAASKPSATEMQNYQKAIEKASSLLEFYPKSRWVDDALMMLGECFYFRGEYSRALRKFEEVIKLYPDSRHVPYAHLYTAKTFLGLTEFDNAEKKFRDVALDASNPARVRQEAEYELAGLYYVKENYDLAADEYRRTAKESGDELIRAMSLYRLGECLIKLKYFDQAPDVFKRAVDASPNVDFRSQATIKMGEAQSLVKDYQAAIRTFSVLLSKELEVKRIPIIKLHLANNYRLNGDLESALKWYKNIIEEHKSTEASAQSYYALGEIEEFVNHDYRKAKENYDLVRGEASSSQIAVKAKDRSDSIKEMLDLRQSIDELLGIATKIDSLDEEGGNGKKKKSAVDDAPIDLSADGMWMNYTGRDRPAPRSLAGTEAERAGLVSAATDSSVSDSTSAQVALPDSAKEAERQKSLELKKAAQLAEKRLALAELLMFNFDKPDSAMQLFLQVVESKPDSNMTSRALYSIGYIMRSVRKDTMLADSLFRALIYLYPKSPHAEGARRFLGQPLLSEKVDSAMFVFARAEEAYWRNKNAEEAMQLYASIGDDYPESPFAAKAQYGIGWLYENALNDYDKAIATYKTVVEKYPESIYGKELKAKLARHEQAIQAIEARKKAIADSIAQAEQKLAQAIADSLRGGAPDSTQAALAATAADSSAQSDSLATAANQDSSAQSDSLATATGPDSLAAPVLSDSVVDTAGVRPPDAAPPLDTPVLQQQEEDMALPDDEIKPDDSKTPQKPKKPPKDDKKRNLEELR